MQILNQFKLLKKFLLSILLILPVVISSCYVDYGLNSNNYNVVGTFYNPDYNFNNVTSYYFLDTVLQINGAVATRQFDNTIKNTTLSNLNSLGWTRVYDSTGAGVVIVGNVVTTADYTVTVDNGCWGDIWSYNMCYSYDSYYDYTTGTVGVLIVDLNQSNGQSLPIEWIGVGNGVISSGGNISQFIINGINQAFAQSPYLH